MRVVQCYSTALFSASGLMPPFPGLQKLRIDCYMNAMPSTCDIGVQARQAASGGAGGDSTTTTPSAPPPLTPKAADLVPLLVTGATGAAAGATALRCGAEATFESRLAFVRASSANFSYLDLSASVAVAMVMF
jgi:hypothetical protein